MLDTVTDVISSARRNTMVLFGSSDVHRCEQLGFAFLAIDPNVPESRTRNLHIQVSLFNELPRERERQQRDLGGAPIAIQSSAAITPLKVIDGRMTDSASEGNGR